MPLMLGGAWERAVRGGGGLGAAERGVTLTSPGGVLRVV